jgi:plastocyanin
VNAVDNATFGTWLKQHIDAAAATPPPPPSGQPSGGPSGQPGQPSGQPSGATLDISAQNIAYSTDALSAPANQPFTINFDNEDTGVPHNVAIHDAAGTEVFKGEIITGPAKAPYAVPPLAAGTYQFMCSVHPSMTGTLTVQ